MNSTKLPSSSLVQFCINGFGENDIAAFAVYFKVENLIYLPIMAFGQTMVTFTGQNIGARQTQRIQKGAIQYNLLSMGIIGLISGIILLFGKEILGLFCADEAVVAEGLRIIHVSFPFYLFCFENYRKYYKMSWKIPAVYGSCNSNFMCTAYNPAKNF